MGAAVATSRWLKTLCPLISSLTLLLHVDGMEPAVKSLPVGICPSPTHASTPANIVRHFGVIPQPAVAICIPCLCAITIGKNGTIRDHIKLEDHKLRMYELGVDEDISWHSVTKYLAAFDGLVDRISLPMANSAPIAPFAFLGIRDGFQCDLCGWISPRRTDAVQHARIQHELKPIPKPRGYRASYDQPEPWTRCQYQQLHPKLPAARFPVSPGLLDETTAQTYSPATQDEDSELHGGYAATPDEDSGPQGRDPVSLEQQDQETELQSNYPEPVGPDILSKNTTDQQIDRSDRQKPDPRYQELQAIIHRLSQQIISGPDTLGDLERASELVQDLIQEASTICRPHEISRASSSHLATHPPEFAYKRTLTGFLVELLFQPGC